MIPTNSSKWIRFSDYQIRTSEEGIKYICPAPGSASVIYDPVSKPDKLAISVLDTAEAFAEDKSDETLLLDLVRSIGLPGFTLDSSAEYAFPFGGDPAEKSILLLAQRGPEYACVFSRDYAEKYDDLCSWLEKINSSNDCSCSVSLNAEPDYTNLKSMAEYCITSLSQAGKLHICAHCGKIYYSADPESKTCSKPCEFQVKLMEDMNSPGKKCCCHFAGGG